MSNKAYHGLTYIFNFLIPGQSFKILNVEEHQKVVRSLEWASPEVNDAVYSLAWRSDQLEQTPVKLDPKRNLLIFGGNFWLINNTNAAILLKEAVKNLC